MRLEKIITLANRKVLLRFRAMERSLRATGCQLPLWVIPYDDDRFDLPDNATWWSMPDLETWLREEKMHPTYRKYQCLTEANYQFLDSDAIFLINPETVLADKDGFVASCGHWRDAKHTVTAESLPVFRSLSSLWEKNVFNTGQFACDRALYTVAELQRQCLNPRHIDTCMKFKFHEQPGVNLLVNISGVPILNLTLPSPGMESTWAGDYLDENYAAHWTPEEKKPYLMHWAGRNTELSRPIDRLFLDYLTASERAQLELEMEQHRQKLAREKFFAQSFAARLRRSARAFLSEWRN